MYYGSRLALPRKFDSTFFCSSSIVISLQQIQSQYIHNCARSAFIFVIDIEPRCGGAFPVASAFLPLNPPPPIPFVVYSQHLYASLLSLLQFIAFHHFLIAGFGFTLDELAGGLKSEVFEFSLSCSRLNGNLLDLILWFLTEWSSAFIHRCGPHLRCGGGRCRRCGAEGGDWAIGAWIQHRLHY